MTEIPEGMKELHDGTFVPKETPTRLKSGKRYLLTEAEKYQINEERAKRVLRNLKRTPDKFRKGVNDISVTIEDMEFKPNKDTLMAIVGLTRLMEEVNDPEHTISYKAENGFFELDYQKIKTVGVVLGGIQQKAFSAQMNLSKEIDEGLIPNEDAAATRFSELMEA